MKPVKERLPIVDATIKKGLLEHAKTINKMIRDLDKIKDDDGDTGFWTEETADKDEIQGKVAGVEAFRIFNEGIVNLPEQSRVRAYQSVAQVVSSGAWEILETNVINTGWDPHNEFNTTTFRMTVTKGGVYQIVASVGVSDMIDAKLVQVGIKRNGNWIVVTNGHASHTATLGVVCFAAENLSANDYLEAFVYQNSGVDKTLIALSKWTFLTVIKMI